MDSVLVRVVPHRCLGDQFVGNAADAVAGRLVHVAVGHGGGLSGVHAKQVVFVDVRVERVGAVGILECLHRGRGGAQKLGDLVPVQSLRADKVLDVHVGSVVVTTLEWVSHYAYTSFCTYCPQ